MKHHRASSSRAIKLVSLALCFSLIAAAVLPLGSAGAQESHPVASASGLKPQSGLLSFPGRALGSFLTLLQGGGLPSVPGPNLPDLDAARQTQTNEPTAPPAIASVQSCEDCALCPDCQINRKPIALHGGPYFGSAAQPIDFNGLGSFDPDPDDEISDYIWTFGDSSPAVEVHGGTPTHTYASPGVYTVTNFARQIPQNGDSPCKRHFCPTNPQSRKVYQPADQSNN